MILIALPNTGSVRAELVPWLLKQNELHYKKKDLEVLFRYQQPVDINRNSIVNYFLNSEHEWLLMIDSDQVPRFNVTDILKSKKKIVSAMTTVLAAHKTDKNETINIPMPLIMKRAKVKGVYWRKIEHKDFIEKGNNRTGLIEVDGVGTGVLLIHRSVLLKMKPPWFKFLMLPNGNLKLSEDYSFCVKAKKAGFKMFVDTNCQAGHLKLVDLYELNKAIYKLISSKKKVTVEKFEVKKKKSLKEKFKGFLNDKLHKNVK